MRVHVQAICWNEEVRIPHFLKHYERFADKIIVYDNGSTDSSRELLLKHPLVELKQISSGNEFREDVLMWFRNESWKPRRNDIRKHCDWLMIVDLDEFIYRPDLRNLLERTEATVLHPHGFEMVPTGLPLPDGLLIDHIQHGVSDEKHYSKPCLFKPYETTIMLGPGGHELTSAIGKVNIQRDIDLKLLHYRYLDTEWYLARAKQLAERNSQYNRERNFCWHYGQSEEWHRERISTLLATAQRVIF
jgi:glycosyltransferase involved in cell wall biosynthesis